jgi:glycosyltransferase involved in cell wall biosynthesis
VNRLGHLDGAQPGPCVVIACGTVTAAEGAATRGGFHPHAILTKFDCAAGLGAVRRSARRAGVATVLIHSADWEREPLAQFFELAALRLGLPNCRVLGDDGTIRREIPRAVLAWHAATTVPETAAALGRIGLELQRLARDRHDFAASMGVKPSAVMVIWPGVAGTAVGGSVTHMSGVLAALKHLDVRVGLLSFAPPPPVFDELADDLEVMPPLPRSARVSKEVAAVCANQTARRAGQRLIARLRPAFVYQRHEAFLTCGLDLAEQAQIPLVLEWNNSEAWARRNWHAQMPVKLWWSPLATVMERRVLRGSKLVAAVSTHSAAMALDGGANADRVLVLPNGVDLSAVDSALGEPTTRRTIGWVGSFFPWHGANVLLEAMANLPAEIDAVLIGDGPERGACQSLAGELGLGDRIEWTGTLDHHEAIRRLGSCELLVSPHVPMDGRPFFGSPTKIFEYMAIGPPLVASPREQIADVLDDGRTARLVAPGDPLALAGAVESILALPDHGNSLGAAARADAEAHHTWESRMRVLLDALQTEVQGARGLPEPAATHR